MTLAAVLEVVDEAMLSVVIELSMEFDTADDAMVTALRQPITVAALFDDLSRHLGMTTPEFVRIAIEGV